MAELRMRFVCANGNKSPLHRACQDLFISLCGDALLDTCYLASVCELYSSIRSSDIGFSIRIHGFDEKLMILAKTILSTCLSFRNRAGQSTLPSCLKRDRFKACLEVLKRKYNNSSMKASAQVTDMRLRCIRKDQISARAKLDAITNISIDNFNDIIAENLESIRVDALLHGNVDRDDALNAESMIKSAVLETGCGGFSMKKWPYQQVLKIPLLIKNQEISSNSLDPTEPNTAVEIYFQMKDDDNRTRAVIDLLSEMMYEPLYDQVRTKEQFGYQVSCGARWTFGVIGMSFKVVTSNRSANEVVDRLEKFLVDYRVELENMTTEKFLEHCVGLVRNKLLKSDNLEEECSSHWEKIIERKDAIDWEQSRNEAVELRGITKKEVIVAFDKWLAPFSNQQKPNKRRRIIVKVIGSSEKSHSEMQEEDISCAVDDEVRKAHSAIGNNTWGKYC